MTWKDDIKPNCNSSIYPIEFEIKNITWNNYNPEPEYMHERVERTKINTKLNMLINNDINNLNTLKTDQMNAKR